jgi:hypothetical protein
VSFFVSGFRKLSGLDMLLEKGLVTGGAACYSSDDFSGAGDYGPYRSEPGDRRSMYANKDFVVFRNRFFDVLDLENVRGAYLL